MSTPGVKAHKRREYEPVVCSDRGMLPTSCVETQAGQDGGGRNEETTARDGQAGADLQCRHL